MTNRAFTIGIITGSGPEAGIDLWSKVLTHTQRLLGDRFGGDLDAPRVVIVSEPQLGLSMDLRENEVPTRAGMMATVREIAPRVDIFAIACNTLNWFAPEIDAVLATIPDAGKLVSFQSLLEAELLEQGVGQVGLLAAGPVLALDEWSAYTALTSRFTVETPAEPAKLHTLIEDVKRLGKGHPSLAPRFAEIACAMASDTLLLACTELPLIAVPVKGKTMIDVTDKIALELAKRAIAARKEAQ